MSTENNELFECKLSYVIKLYYNIYLAFIFFEKIPSFVYFFQ